VIRRRVVVTGLVQGVFFRDTCRREARGRQVAGWVGNRPDGSVEAVFEGDDADVEAMVEWARHGPPQADVDHFVVHTEVPQGERSFQVR
jgi:acylphosphatase